jgi:hypothetical protein
MFASNVTLAGYPDNYLGAVLDGLDIQLGESRPAIIEVEDALYVPGFGGLYRPDGSLASMSAMTGSISRLGPG